MMITKKSLPRRAFLRGAGTILALPLLDAMVPALSALAKTAARPPRRLGFVYIPNGVNMHEWRPVGEGADFTLSPSLAPLAPFRDRLVVVSGLSSFPAEGKGDGAGDHARASASWLSAVRAKKTQGADVELGKTLDQIAADELGMQTQLSSLQLSTDNIGMVGNCDAGYACTYENTISWRTPTSPLPMQTNPRVVFERLFGDGSSTDERRAQLAAQRSILDSVGQEATRLQLTLGHGDRTRMQDYFEAVRQTEQRIEKIEKQSIELPSSAELPVGIPDAYGEHVQLMFDLQVLAYQADITRVSAFLMSREASQRTYPQIGVPDAHHGISHHGDDPEKLAKLAKVDRYHVERLAYYLDKLAAVPDGDGSLLEHSLIMFGGCISNGNNHSHRDLPTLLVGGGGGTVKGGRHIMCGTDTPLANLQVSVLDKMGVRIDRFGDSSGTLSEL